jgi:uncharacterized protein YcnI
VVEIPAEITAQAKPHQLPGWNVSFTYRPLAVPSTKSNGFIVNQTVASIVWTVSKNTSEFLLDDSMYQDFGISVKLPDLPEGTLLYFKTTQYCYPGNQSIAWIDTSNAGGEGGKPSPKLWLNTTSDAEKALLSGVLNAGRASSATGISCIITTSSVLLLLMFL